MLTIACGVILSVWAIASILNQFPLKINEEISLLDPYVLIPQWYFFAPNPGTFDYHLLYRDSHQDFQSSWIEVTLLFERNNLSFLWNPNKRINKALFDISETLQQIERREKDNKNFVYISLPYLYLLNLVASQPRGQETQCLRQFIIVRNYGRNKGKEDEIVFISKIHTV